MTQDLIIGIDAGTSVIKAAAFDLSGRQIASAGAANVYTTRAEDGAAFQPMEPTWATAAGVLKALGERVPGLAARALALAVTAQGDGTWLVDAAGEPVTDGWLWLDARAAPTVKRLRASEADAARYQATGTGLNVCQQGSQLAHLLATAPEILARAATALHPKDFLYLRLTGERATDPSEACFTFGDFRTGHYSEAAIEALGLKSLRRLLPPILDGSKQTHPLSPAAAAATGLRAGTPVSLGYVDVVCTALGGGIIAERPGACTIIGSTAMHMLARPVGEIALNDERTGYVMRLPVEGMAAMMQSTMAATLNIDWLLALAGDLAAELGAPQEKAALIGRIDGWMKASKPGALVYHPYISEAGERGPFVNASARASLIGLNMGHRFPDLARAVIEGLALSARDCFAAMKARPEEIRLTGGAARSRALRGTLAAAVGARARVSSREEAGAAGAAMMAATAAGVYPDMRAAIKDWVAPSLGEAEAPDAGLQRLYGRIYPVYRDARLALAPVWDGLKAAHAMS